MNEEQTQDFLREVHHRYILRTVKDAKKNGWKTRGGESWLALAARSVHMEDLFLALLQHGCRVDHIDDRGNNLIMQMIINRRYNVADQLFDKGMYDLARKNHFGYTVMALAVDHPPLLQKFIMTGAPVNIESDDSHSLLWHAFYRTKKESVLSLLAVGATLSTTIDETANDLYLVFFMNERDYEMIIIILLILNRRIGPSQIDGKLAPSTLQLIEEGPSLAQRCWFVHEIAKRKCIFDILKQNSK